MKKTVVINVVGLTQALIGEHTPNMRKFLDDHQVATITPVLPAVTCSAQTTYLTGQWPSQHGIVGNGWYFKDECEVKFWRQSNKLVQSEKLWDLLKRDDPSFTCANMFWWYNMYTTADYGVTPRPNYLADGRKIPDIYAYPASLRDHLQQKLGTFPLFEFWGPKTTINSSRWIARASVEVDKLRDPTLTLIYLPHLDYNMQRHGNDLVQIQGDLREVDEVVGELIDHYRAQGAQIVLLSEYGITEVNRPVHLNRVLREAGLLSVRVERGLEILDAGASRAFAVADHQIAHVYLNDASVEAHVRRLLEGLGGVERVLSRGDIAEAHLDHERSGDLVVVADRDSWFTYYYWLDDAKAPDFARMVDIHKKPGYDPVEMMTDPKDRLVMAKVASKLLRKKLGFRTVLDIIPLDASLIKGSHGRIPESDLDHPVLIANAPELVATPTIQAIDVCGILATMVRGKAFRT